TAIAPWTRRVGRAPEDRWRSEASLSSIRRRRMSIGRLASCLMARRVLVVGAGAAGTEGPAPVPAASLKAAAAAVIAEAAAAAAIAEGDTGAAAAEPDVPEECGAGAVAAERIPPGGTGRAGTAAAAGATGAGGAGTGAACPRAVPGRASTAVAGEPPARA